MDRTKYRQLKERNHCLPKFSFLECNAPMHCFTSILVVKRERDVSRDIGNHHRTTFQGCIQYIDEITMHMQGHETQVPNE